MITVTYYCKFAVIQEASDYCNSRGRYCKTSLGSQYSRLSFKQEMLSSFLGKKDHCIISQVPVDDLP